MPYARSHHLKDLEKLGLDRTPRHRAIYILQKLLKLNKSQFTEMKEKFQEITSSNFDLGKVGHTQTQALEMAIEDVTSHFPAWFKKGNVEQRKFFARRAILIMHASRRKYQLRRTSYRKENKKTSEEDEDDARSDIDKHSQQNKALGPRSLTSAKPGPSLTQRMAANLLSIKNGSQAPKIFASPPRALRNAESSSNDPVIRLPLSDISVSSGSLARPQPPLVGLLQTPKVHPDASFSLSSISELGVPHTQVPPSSLARHDSSHIYRLGTIKAEKTSFSTSAPSSSNMMAESSTSASCEDTLECSSLPPQHEVQIRSIHNFLETVEPPMPHLLHRFIEFGCLGEDFLFAVSTWPSERIRIFLKSLPPGPGGSALTKMELDILTYHFESYFLTSKP